MNCRPAATRCRTAEPVTVRELEARMPHGSDPAEALMLLRTRYEGRGVRVVRVECDSCEEQGYLYFDVTAAYH